jgi:eukaryotic-like serine/threonine-protein kinase
VEIQDSSTTLGHTAPLEAPEESGVPPEDGAGPGQAGGGTPNPLDASNTSILSEEFAVRLGGLDTGGAEASGMPVDDEPPRILAGTRPGTAGGRIGRFRILGEVDRGGIGVIYKVRDDHLGRDLALKLLSPTSAERPDASRQFIEEAQVAGQLEHPGIVPVHELGLAAGTIPYFTMQFVMGEALETLLEKRSSIADERQRFLNIFEQVCRTVAYAHARGVIHRDLKPSNIMVGRFGEVFVMDWGLAKVLPGGGAREARQAPAPAAVHPVHANAGTSNGSVMGTLAYMAPEQAQGLVEELDERSDVFGLGAILCEILTGKPPYVGKTAGEIYQLASSAALDGALGRLHACGADDEIVALATQCLAPARGDRPRDAKSVAKVMRAYFGCMEEKKRAAELEAAEARVRVRGERKARWLEFAMACIVLALLVIGGNAYLRFRDALRVTEARVTAEAEERIVAELTRIFEDVRRLLAGRGVPPRLFGAPPEAPVNLGPRPPSSSIRTPRRLRRTKRPSPFVPSRAWKR